MNTKRKNNNFKTVKNDTKNNTYAIVLCVLIIFWTIASFLGTIAFFRSFDDDDTMVVSADTAVSSRVADIDMSYFNKTSFGSFQIPIMNYYNIYVNDNVYRPYMQYYIDFVDNIPVGVAYSNGVDSGYFDYENAVVIDLQDEALIEYNLSFETPLYEDGLDYWEDFFEGALYFDNAVAFCVTNDYPEYQDFYSGYELRFRSTSSSEVFYIRIYNTYFSYYTEPLNDTNFYSSIGSYANYSKWLEGYNAGYTGTQTDITNARQEGYNQGYADGLNKNKYGPFSNMTITIGFNNLFDQGGDSLATGWYTEFRSDDIPNALYSIGFNADRFYNDYVYPTILDEFEDYDTFDDVYLDFDYQGNDFSSTTYPLRFYLASLASESPVDVLYTDGTDVTYYFISNTDEGGETYYTIPFDSNKSIDRLGITLRGGQDIISSLSISVYGQAYQDGYNAGSSVGYNNGYTAGKDIGYEQGYNGGFQVGKQQGFNEGVASANEYSFLGLLTSVVDAPLKVFYDMFDFEILGYNMSSFFLALLSICIVIAVVKVILAR